MNEHDQATAAEGRSRSGARSRFPAGLLWGTALGAGAGLLFGNLVIGALIGAGLGVGIGFTVFAAAIVIASGKV